MNVPAYIAHQLVAGHATQVRVPAPAPKRLRDGRHVPPRCTYTQGTHHDVHPIRIHTFTIEGWEGVQTHTEPDHTIGRVLITSHYERSLLGAVTLDDIVLEQYPDGVTTPEQVVKYWQLHRPTVNDQTPVWVLTVKPYADPIRRLTSTGRPAGRSDKHGTWHGPETDYTPSGYNAMPGEPEAVDQATQARITARAGMEHAQWAAIDDARRETRTLDERLREAMTLADANDIDVRRQVASIKQRIAALERKIARSAA